MNWSQVEDQSQEHGTFIELFLVLQHSSGHLVMCFYKMTSKILSKFNKFLFWISYKSTSLHHSYPSLQLFSLLSSSWSHLNDDCYVYMHIHMHMLTYMHIHTHSHTHTSPAESIFFSGRKSSSFSSSSAILSFGLKSWWSNHIYGIACDAL